MKTCIDMTGYSDSFSETFDEIRFCVFAKVEIWFYYDDKKVDAQVINETIFEDFGFNKSDLKDSSVAKLIQDEIESIMISKAKHQAKQIWSKNKLDSFKYKIIYDKIFFTSYEI